MEGKIKQIVAEHFQVTVEQIEGKCRKREYVEPRHLAMALVKLYTGLSLKGIGRVFNRDHTTVIHGIEMVGSLMIQRKFKDHWSALIQKIELNHEESYEWERVS